MKTLFYTAIFVFGCTGIAAAQETMDRLEQQPQPVTQTQVERDARLAQEERRKHDESAKQEQEKLPQDKKQEEQQVKSATNSKNTKASNSPGKQ